MNDISSREGLVGGRTTSFASLLTSSNARRFVSIAMTDEYKADKYIVPILPAPRNYSTDWRTATCTHARDERTDRAHSPVHRNRYERASARRICGLSARFRVYIYNGFDWSMFLKFMDKWGRNAESYAMRWFDWVYRHLLGLRSVLCIVQLLKKNIVI